MPEEPEVQARARELLVDQCTRLALVCEALLVRIDRLGTTPRGVKTDRSLAAQLRACSERLIELAPSEVADDDLTAALLTAIGLAEQAIGHMRRASRSLRATRNPPDTDDAAQSASSRLLSHLGQSRERILTLHG
jgi:hypothetical protein